MRRTSASWLAIGALAACAVGVLVLVLSSGGGACPAVGYSSHLSVTLDDGWANRDRLTVSVACTGAGADRCQLPGTSSGPVWEGDVVAPTPTMQATVADGGRTVAVQTFEPAFVVVDHPAGPRCGGPSSAQVRLAPPA